MDSGFSFLNTAHADLLNEILSRRRPTLLEQIRKTDSVTRLEADEITAGIGEELTDNLGDGWEPTDYGQAVAAVLALLSRAQGHTLLRILTDARDRWRAITTDSGDGNRQPIAFHSVLTCGPDAVDALSQRMRPYPFAARADVALPRK
jgi:hypothetical protein